METGRDQKKKRMEDHFKITGGKCVYENSGVKVLVGPKNVTFVGKGFRLTYPFTGNVNTRFYSADERIFYKSDGRLRCFNPSYKTNKNVCPYYSKILENYTYSYNNTLILQFSKHLVRVCDGKFIKIHSKTDYIIKGDDKYIVVANVRFRDSDGKWSHFKRDRIIRPSAKRGTDYELRYRILSARDFTIIGKSSLGIDAPQAGELANAKLFNYLHYIRNNIQVTNNHIKIFDTYLEYNFTSVPPADAQKPKLVKEECCICFEKRHSITIGPCSHRVCNVCVKQITACPLCRAKITSYKSVVVV